MRKKKPQEDRVYRNKVYHDWLYRTVGSDKEAFGEVKKGDADWQSSSFQNKIIMNSPHMFEED